MIVLLDELVSLRRIEEGRHGGDGHGAPWAFECTREHCRQASFARGSSTSSEGKSGDPLPAGDVKYHKGYSSVHADGRRARRGRACVQILRTWEIVNPVRYRAWLAPKGDASDKGDGSDVLPVRNSRAMRAMSGAKAS
ncbi:hypothetical protein ACFFYR_02015 [Paraburkholderia dipogonis]|uniref:hypothetical protein n=1 Tax=Paraburkholderia dipogonis TaxID=1211383 RepID=UPI0035EC3066